MKTKEKYITSYYYNDLDDAWIDYMELADSITYSEIEGLYIHFFIVGAELYEIRVINIE